MCKIMLSETQFFMINHHCSLIVTIMSSMVGKYCNMSVTYIFL